MSNCSDFPTADDMKALKLNSEFETEFVESSNDTATTPQGQSKTTITGFDSAATAQRADFDAAFQAQSAQFDATFTAQFAYTRIGNISDFVGDTLTDAEKLNSYQYPDDSGEWYGPIQSQTFPITIPANPSTDSGWALVNALKSSDIPTYTDLVYKSSGGNSAVDNMIAENPIAAGIGDICSTGGTTWKRTAVSIPSVIGDFIVIGNDLLLDDFGVIYDDSTDNSAKLMLSREVMMNQPENLWEISCNSDGIVSYSNNGWLEGVKKFKLTNIQTRCTNNDASNFRNSPFRSASCFDDGYNTNTRLIGPLFKSASKGDSQIEMVTPSDAGRFIVGSTCLLYGYNTQFGGFPGNYKAFDWVKITSTNPTTGVVQFDGFLTHDYDESWPDFDSSVENVSAPRILPYTRLAADGWPSDIQGNEYAEFDNVIMHENPNASTVPFNFTSIVRKVIDCEWLGNGVYFAAQTARDCETSNLTRHQNNTVELDKNTRTCNARKLRNVDLTAATGVEYLTFSDSSFDGVNIAPRNAAFNNCDMSKMSDVLKNTTTGKPIRSFTVSNSDIGTTIANNYRAHSFYFGYSINSGLWQPEGNGEIRLPRASFSSDQSYVNALASIEKGVFIAFTADGTQDAGIVSSTRFDGTDFIFSLYRTSQYPTFNQSSGLIVLGAFPQFKNCSFNYGEAFFGEDSQGIQQRGTKSVETVIYRETDLSSQSMTKTQKIKEIRIQVTRAYTGVDNINLRVFNIGGAASGGNEFLSIPVNAVGTFTFNSGTDAFFNRIMGELRFQPQSNPSGDWSDPLLGPRYILEVDYMPIV